MHFTLITSLGPKYSSAARRWSLLIKEDADGVSPGTVFTEMDYEMPETRYTMQISGSEVRYYRNYSGPGSVPIYVSKIPVPLPMSLDASVTNKASFLNVTTGGRPEYITTYSSAQQIEDTGDDPPPETFRFRVYEERTFQNVVYQGDATDFIIDVPPVSSLQTDLVSAWKLDEASGTRLDSFGNNDLADNNTVTQATGKVGDAAHFTNANSEYLSIADNADLSTGDIDFTVWAWVYADSFPDTGYIVAKSNGSTSGEYLLYRLFTTNRFRFGIQNGATFVIVSADTFGAPSTGTWYFVVGWHDSVANTVNIQVNNGTVDSVSTGATVPANSTEPFHIGANSTPAAFWDGRIDAVGFSKRVLTSGERTTLYNGGAGLEYPF